MECAPVTKLLDGPGWFYEIKFDGYRAIAVKSDRVVKLFSRRHKSFNDQYPYLVEALGGLPEGTVVDGEVVALDDSGRPNFNLLAQFRSGASRIHYFIFDLLVRNDRDLTKLPLGERRELMKSVLKLRSPLIRMALIAAWLHDPSTQSLGSGRSGGWTVGRHSRPLIRP
jgi:ATP-dependent DNA ligase